MTNLTSLKEEINTNNQKFLIHLDRESQKKIGQFTTPERLAKFMVKRLIENADLESNNTIKLLDPGAGSGTLGIALVENIIRLDNSKKIFLVAYENDELALKFLRINLSALKEWTLKNNVDFDYEIRAKDYVLDNKNLFEHRLYDNEYDLIISNPPYKKLSIKSEESKLFPFVVYGSPNEYSFFLTKSILELKANGTCVYITPRSWLSGAYFEKFRKFVLSKANLVEIYSFKARTNIFGATKVLQELVVFVLKKKDISHIKYGVFDDLNSINSSKLLTLNKQQAIVGKEKRILIITSKQDLKILSESGLLKSTLIKSGLKMKTGLTVTFRNKDSLLERPKKGAVPIFYPSNFDNYVIKIKKQKFQYIRPIKSGLVQKNKDYIFVKRFSSKEQKRRVQTAYYKASDYPEYREISTDNKLDFIVSDNSIILKGAFIFLASTFFDKYYRLIGGNTQVNSSEINSMRFPTKKELKILGSCFDFKKLMALTQTEIDKIVDNFMEKEKSYNV